MVNVTRVLLVSGFVLINSGCVTPYIWNNIGVSREETVEVARDGGILTSEHLILSLRMKVHQESSDYESAAVYNRWASVEIADLIEKQKPYDWTFYTADPMASTQTLGEKVLVRCEGFDPALGHCLIHDGDEIYGKLPLPVGTSPPEYHLISIDVPLERRWREAWGYPVSVLLTPIGVAVDIIYVLAIGSLGYLTGPGGR